MDPEARKELPGRPFRLRDLILVVRKDQVDSAAVDVDGRRPQQPHGHRRALDVPARPARSTADVPGRLARFRRLPEHEIAHILLRIRVGVHARAGLHAGVIETRELPVLGE